MMLILKKVYLESQKVLLFFGDGIRGSLPLVLFIRTKVLAVLKDCRCTHIVPQDDGHQPASVEAAAATNIFEIKGLSNALDQQPHGKLGQWDY